METLIDRVLEEIVKDVNSGDLTAIEGLLEKISVKDLIDYLPEEIWEKFNIFPVL